MTRQAADEPQSFRAALDQMSEAVAITDDDGQLHGPRILYVNRAFTRVSGYSPAEIVGRSIQSLEGGRADRSVLARIAETLKKCGEFAERMPRRRKNGEQYVAECRVIPLAASGTRGSNWLWIERELAAGASDATGQRRRTEEALRSSEEQHRQIFKAATDAFFIYDYERRIVEVNPAACALYGYRHEELIGLTGKDVVHPDYYHRFENFKKAVQTTGRFFTESVDVRKDGSTFDVEVRGSAVTFRGQPHLLATVRDITERKRAEAALREAHDKLEQRVRERTAEFKEAQEQLQRTERLASIGTLAAGIAHEINNPVGGILISAQSALDEIDEPRDRAFIKKCLLEITEDAKRCGRIIQSILRFARQEPTVRWPYDLNALVKRALYLTRAAVEQHGGTLTLHLTGDLPLIAVNPTEFEQILINLIQNAMEAGGAGTRVTVATERCETGVRVTVADNGPGMPPQQLEHIFDPFYTTHQQTGGLGLGLSVVHGIVQAHGGSIDVTSNPRQGTTFTIELPC